MNRGRSGSFCTSVLGVVPALLTEFLDRLREARERLFDAMPIAIVLPPDQLVIFVLRRLPAG
jgi:hypothetical protein